MDLLLKNTKNIFNKLHILLVFLIAGVAIFFYGLHEQQSVRVLSFDATFENPISNSSLKYAPERIVIKSVEIDLPVVQTKITDGVWEIPENAVGHLETSAVPGEEGNIIVYGHNKDYILGRLTKNLKAGDAVTLYANTVEFNYIVTDITTVTPDDLTVIYPTDHEVLTIYTCTGLFDSKRLVIKAYPSN